MVALARRFNVPVLDDLGSGALLDTARYGLPHEPTVQESPKLDIPEETPAPPPVMAPMAEQPVVNLAQQPAGKPETVSPAWTPRQARSAVLSVRPAADTEPHASIPEAEPEIPHIIPTEFSLGTRRNPLSRWFGTIRIVRLDTRGKAVFLIAAVALTVTAVLIAKSVFFTSPQERELRQALQTISNDVKEAQGKIGNDQSSARQLLVRALASLSNYSQTDSAVKDLSASIIKTMDSLDNASDASPSLIAQFDADVARPLMAVWSSASHSIWMVTAATDQSYSIGRLQDVSTSDDAARVYREDVLPCEYERVRRDAIGRLRDGEQPFELLFATVSRIFPTAWLLYSLAGLGLALLGVLLWLRWNPGSPERGRRSDAHPT